jgi:hypothetical protein
MYFVELEDDSGGLSCIVWPESVKKHKKVLRRGVIISVVLRKNSNGCFLEWCKFIKNVWKEN